MNNAQKRERLTIKKLKSEIDEIKNRKSNTWSLYSSLILLATLVISGSTLCNFFISKNMLEQMNRQTLQTDKSIKIQSDYYQKTIRPYVYVDSLGFNVPKKGKIFKIKYHLKNSGSLPALNVNPKLIMSKQDSVFEIKEFISGTSPSIFPNKAKIVEHQQGFMPLEVIKEKPFVHILIVYSDFGGNLYYFKEITLVKNIDSNDPSKPFRMISTFSDFN